MTQFGTPEGISSEEIEKSVDANALINELDEQAGRPLSAPIDYDSGEVEKARRIIQEVSRIDAPE